MYLSNYLLKLNYKGLKESVEEVSRNVCENIDEHFDFRSNMSGLLLGNVQSGKTAQMLGVIARLADKGYRIFVILTSDNVDLQRQTYKRTFKSLSGFDVLSEIDDALFHGASSARPLVLVLKKNSTILRKWRDLLLSSNYCRGQILVIFDDEGDNASLNTLVNKQRVSTINRHIDVIRNSASSSIYIEVTATPQALLLQSSISGWHPEFVNYFKPGNGYLGGDFFYSEPQSYTVRYTDEHELDDVVVDDDNICPIGLQMSIMSYLVVCAHKKIQGETNCNLMIHPSVRTNIHFRFSERVQEHLNLLQRSLENEDFEMNLRDSWLDLQKTYPNLESYDDIKDAVESILNNTEILVVPLNSRSSVSRDPENPDALNLSEGFNIVIGGNTLGRGVTFPHLQTVYYCRTSRTPQADTFWQHSRVFGYDREAGLVRIFIPRTLYKLFCDLNKANSVLIKQIEQYGVESIELIYPQGIKPTRKNVLDHQFLNVLLGGVNIFPVEPIMNNAIIIDSIVKGYSVDTVHDVDAQLLINLLLHSGSIVVDDFDSKKFISYIKALEGKRPKTKYKLLLQINRNITKGTGTLLSQKDRNIADNFMNDVVLIMYRLNGQLELGWNGNPLWVPNIKFPSDCCFYDVK
ncbi:MAG: hypothetical protein IJ548_07925 [Paludibacteraceae bacterium]|nr:hypothetical protein [Paludibacteraceae bacterium]MBQ8715265.1 hypothetical protein [Prevotella sp.]